MLIFACGGDEMSLAEYVDRIDLIFEKGISEYETLVNSPEGLVLIVGQGPHFGFDDQGLELSDFTTQDLHVALERLAEIQAEALEAAADIDPPDRIADLHALYFRALPIAELAARAGTAATWEELSASPEMGAYRDALAADNQVCADFQAELDAADERGAFAAAPWIKADLEDIANNALDCDSLPADPGNAYRP
jgi:hypothetical protein